MATLLLNPNLAEPSTWITVNGNQFSRTATRIRVDGTIVGLDSFKPNATGSFSVGFQCRATDGTQSVEAQQKKAGKWVAVAPPATLIVKTVVVPPPPIVVAPVADYTVTPTTGTAGTSFQFHDVSTGTVTTRQWDIGAGTFKPTDKDPVVVLPAADTWNVVLTVGNSAGSSTKKGTVVVTPVITPPPSGGINVPAQPEALKTAVANAKTGDTFNAAVGNHTYQSGLGYSGIKIDYSVDSVTINGPGAVLLPKGVANGIGVLADKTTIQGSTTNPITITADPAGPASDANGSSLIGINGVLANNPDAPTSDILIQDAVLNFAAIMNDHQQGIYLSGEVHNITVRRVKFYANGAAGYALHDYHAGAAPSTNYLFENLTFTGFKVPVILWNQVDTVTFNNCDFIGSATYDLRLGTGGKVYINNCRGSKGILNEGSTIIESNNNWGWVPPPAGTYTKSGPISITTDNTVIEWKEISSTLDDGAGISIQGTSAKRVKNVTIRNCKVTGFHENFLLEFADTVTLEDCWIPMGFYCGFNVFSSNNVKIIRPRVDLISHTLPNPQGNNAYGVKIDTLNSGDPVCDTVEVSDGVFKESKLWMNMNAHSGKHISFLRNESHDAPRAIFVTNVEDLKIIGNKLLDPATTPGGSTDVAAITYGGITGASIDQNQIDSRYPTKIQDISNQYGIGPSTGVVKGTNPTV